MIAIKDRAGLGTLPGLITKEDVVEFVDQLNMGFSLQSESDRYEEIIAKFEQEKNVPSAMKLYSQILQLQGDMEYVKKFKAIAMGGIVRCGVLEKNVEGARAIAEQIEAEYKEFLPLPEVSSAIFSVEISDEVAKSPFSSLEAAKTACEKDPSNFELRYFYAVTLLMDGKYEEGIEALIGVLKRQRNNAATKELLLKLFNSLGAEHPLSVKGHRGLAKIVPSNNRSEGFHPIPHLQTCIRVNCWRSLPEVLTSFRVEVPVTISKAS